MPGKAAEKDQGMAFPLAIRHSELESCLDASTLGARFSLRSVILLVPSTKQPVGKIVFLIAPQTRIEPLEQIGGDRCWLKILTAVEAVRQARNLTGSLEFRSYTI